MRVVGRRARKARRAACGRPRRARATTCSASTSTRRRFASSNEGLAPVEEPGLQELVSRVARPALARRPTRGGRRRRPDDPPRADALRRARRVLERVPARRDRAGRAGALGPGRLPRRGRREHRDAGIVRSRASAGARARLRPPRRATRLGLCYSPEFIALGNVIRDMLEPDMVLIGESDRRAGDALEQLYAGVCENDPPFRRMSLVNAELTKIAVNTYVTMKISYANTLADMCERLPGADVDCVTDALGLDTRIGGKYLRGAIAYGGPCFPRDNKAFAVLARELGTEAPLAEATDSVNEAQTQRLARIVRSHLEDGDSVGHPRPRVQARHRRRRGEPRGRARRDPGRGRRPRGQRVRSRATSAASRRSGPSAGVRLGGRAARAVRGRGDRDAVEGVREFAGRRARESERRDRGDRLLASALGQAYGDAIEIVRLGRPLRGRPRAEHLGGRSDDERSTETTRFSSPAPGDSSAAGSFVSCRRRASRTSAPSTSSRSTSGTR